MKRISSVLILFLFILGGCGMTDQEAVKPVNPTISLKPKEPVLIKEDSLQKTSGNSIRKAQSFTNRLPKEDEKQILAVLSTFFYSFEQEDMDRYMSTLSKTAQGFYYETQRLETLALLENFPFTLTLKEARVYKTGHDLQKAAVYALVDISSTETPGIISRESVFVFKKDDDGWKISAAVGLPIILN